MAGPAFRRPRRFRMVLPWLVPSASAAAGAQQAPSAAAADAAIAIIQACGLRCEVHTMGTVVEGPPEKIRPLLQAVHQATLDAGAERTPSIIKVSGSAQAGGPRVDDRVGKFRK